MRKIVLFGLIQSAFLVSFGQSVPDADINNKLKQEESQNSKVMDIAFHLTDVSGPRLTASPNFMNAANWAKNTLSGWGLENARLEPWGDFGKGWQQERCYIAMTKPYYTPLVAIPILLIGRPP